MYTIYYLLITIVSLIALVGTMWIGFTQTNNYRGKKSVILLSSIYTVLIAIVIAFSFYLVW